jgi:hypothetical protein
MHQWLRLNVRFLDASSRVHLRSSFLFSPESFKDPFPLSVQYRSITQEAPRGGFLLRLHITSGRPTSILFTASKFPLFTRELCSEHTLAANGFTIRSRACLPAGRQGVRGDDLSVYSFAFLRATNLANPLPPACSQTIC